jgi:hypothetical protein
LRDHFGGARLERLVPVADAVGYERGEAEWLAVPAGAVAAAFPEAVDELRDGEDPFIRSTYTKG